MAFLDASAATYLVARTAAERPLRWVPWRGVAGEVEEGSG
jgi:hypothetical protein